MKKVCLGMATVLLWGTVSWGADAQQILKNVAKQADGALCQVECMVELNGRMVPRKGIGVCIDASGMILTVAIPSQAKADSIENIELILPGIEGKRIPARLLGLDSLTGISFLQAEQAHNWTVVGFQKSANVTLGDLVVSAGLDMRSAGIPLALGMGYIGSEQRMPNRVMRITGGSLSVVGSVVFNAQGRAIGIVTTQPFLPFQVYRREGTTSASLLRNLEQTVSFTPVDEFVRVLTNIPQGGTVRRPSWLGGFLGVIPSGLREAKGLNVPCAMVDQILPNSPADKAGLKDRDVIVGFNGAPLKSFGSDTMTVRALRQKIARMPAGSEVSLTVVQQGKQREIKLKLEPMPLMPREAPKLLDSNIGLVMREKVAMDFASNDPNAKKPGLLVIAVAPKSAAERAGLRTSDLVVSINNKTVTSADAAETILKKSFSQDPPTDLTVEVVRGNTTERLTVRAPRK